MVDSKTAPFFKNIFFNSPALWIHLFRSAFHLTCLAVGIAYSFLQHRFLNADVWIFVYLLSGTALALDAFVFIFYQQFKSWWIVYAFDALFVSLLIYQTGHVFFPFLFLMWLLQIAFAGIHFQFKGALTQGLWISCVFTWVVLLSPHFKNFDNLILSFSINNAMLFVTAIFSGFIGYYFRNINFLSWFNFFGNLTKKDNHPIHRDWEREIQQGTVDFSESTREELSGLAKGFHLSVDKAKTIINSQKSNQEKWFLDIKEEVKNLENQFKNLDEYINQQLQKKKVININHLMDHVVKSICASMPQIDVQSYLKSSGSILGYESRLKNAICGFIHHFILYFSENESHDHLHDDINRDSKIGLKVSVYDDEWAVIQMKWINKDGKNLSSVSDSFFRGNENLNVNIMFFKKVIDEHGGRIDFTQDNEQFTVNIQLPLDKYPSSIEKKKKKIL